MGGAMISVEATSEQEAHELLKAHRAEAEKLGLDCERDFFVGYDDNEKVWRGYLWMHSLPLMRLANRTDGKARAEDIMLEQSLENWREKQGR